MITPAQLREELAEFNDNALTADGFDEALIGYVQRAGMCAVALYDREKCIEILVGQGMGREEANEHFEFNVLNAFMGQGTPCFATIRRSPV